jgi:hypothetical protein
MWEWLEWKSIPVIRTGPKGLGTEPGRSSVFLVRREDTVDVVKIMRVHQLGDTWEARSKSQSKGILAR